MRQFSETGVDQLGHGPVIFSWTQHAHAVAVSGNKPIVHILDRTGSVCFELPLQHAVADIRQCCCCQLQWDASGERLIIIQRKPRQVLLWNYGSTELGPLQLDARLGEPCAVRWASKGPVAVIGTHKGSLIMYNDLQRRKIPVDGLHHKAVLDIVWVDDQHFAVLSADKQTCLYNKQKATGTCQIRLKAQPEEIACRTSPEKVHCQLECEGALHVHRKANPASESLRAVSEMSSRTAIVLGQISSDAATKQMILGEPCTIYAADEETKIVHHTWPSDSLLFMATDSGRCVVVARRSGATMECLWDRSLFDEPICSMSLSTQTAKIALASESQASLLDFSEGFGDSSIETVKSDFSDRVHQVEWTADGQILSISMKNGRLLSFMSQLPLVHDMWMNVAFYLVSVMEMELADFTDPTRNEQLKVKIDPELCAVGPRHLAVSQKNQVWFYAYDLEQSTSPVEIGARKYSYDIRKMKIRANCIVLLSGNQVIGQQLQQMVVSDEYFLRPQTSSSNNALCFDLSSQFIVAASGDGRVVYSSTTTFGPLHEYRHSLGVMDVCVQNSGVRIVLLDMSNSLFTLNPVLNVCLKIQIKPTTNPIVRILWDWCDSLHFAVVTEGQAFPFHIQKSCAERESITPLEQQEIPASFKPLCLNKGRLQLRHKNGSLDSVSLNAREGEVWVSDLLETSDTDRDNDRAETCFYGLLRAGKEEDAWRLASRLQQKEWLRSLGESCIACANVSLAIQAYRALGSGDIVKQLMELEKIEDRNLLSAHSLLLQCGKHEKAKDLFLSSSDPVQAVHMYDKMEMFSEAKELAEKLDTSLLPGLLVRHGKQLEREKQFLQALDKFNQAYDLLVLSEMPVGKQGLWEQCIGGAAKMLFHLDRTKEALFQLENVKQPELIADCARVLEQRAQLGEAAALYERAGKKQKAALLYIQGSNLARASKIAEDIQDGLVFRALAVENEKLKRFDVALKLFQQTEHHGEAVRVLLTHKKQPDAAFDLVRATKEMEGCRSVLQYCKDHLLWKEAIEFSVLMGDIDAAFGLAQKHGMYLSLKEVLREDAPDYIWTRLGDSLEDMSAFEEAGDCYSVSGKLDQALGAYMKAGFQCTDKAVKLLQRTRDREFVWKLLDWASACPIETLGTADALVIFDLRMEQRSEEDAVQWILKRSESAQKCGLYRRTHELLAGAYVRLKQRGTQIPSQLQEALVLIHSYVLAKLHSQPQPTATGALLLKRICQEISLFPEHGASILTSAVVACQRAGYHKTAVKFAALAVHADHRASIPSEYKRKIESLVRRPDRNATDPALVMAACVYCDAPGDEMQLHCTRCGADLPFCVATGKRIGKEGVCYCPHCNSPAGLEDMTHLLRTTGRCPFCSTELGSDDLKVGNRI